MGAHFATMRDETLIKLQHDLLNSDESKWKRLMTRAGLRTKGRDVKTMRFVIVSTESEFVRPLKEWLTSAGYEYHHDLVENIHKAWTPVYNMGDLGILIFNLCGFIPDELVTWEFDTILAHFYVKIQRPHIDFKLYLWDEWGRVQVKRLNALWMAIKQSQRPHNRVVTSRRVEKSRRVGVCTRRRHAENCVCAQFT
jgi:hypothetical protein